MHLTLSAVARTLPIFMSARSWKPPPQVAVLWDVDGTLVESTKLAFDATNEVLQGAGRDAISVDEYKVGCRYTTPERFNFHLGLPTDENHPDGVELGQKFDDTYVARVSRETAGLFDGMDRLLRSLSLNGHPQGVLSNACGAYVRAVMTANELDELPGQRIALMKVAKGADEVPQVTWPNLT
jgi:phosphoglycolate phosphatase-like HAD superfamily hydrolase